MFLDNNVPTFILGNHRPSQNHFQHRPENNNNNTKKSLSINQYSGNSSGGKKSSPQFRWRRRKRRSKAQYPEMSRYLLPIDDGEEVQHLGRTLECTLCGLRGKRCHLTLHFKAKHNEVIDLTRAKNLAAGISNNSQKSTNIHNSKKNSSPSAKQHVNYVNNNNNNNGNTVKFNTCEVSTKLSDPVVIMSKPVLDVSSNAYHHREGPDTFFVNTTPMEDDMHNLSSADTKDHFRANFEGISVSGKTAVLEPESLGVVSSSQFGSSPRGLMMAEYGGVSTLQNMEPTFSPESFSSSEEMSTMSPR